MRKGCLVLVGLAVAVGTLLTAAGPAAAQSFSEDFVTVPPSGWTIVNNSSPVGSNSWFQGNTTVMNAQAGAANSYAGANYNAVNSVGDISDWLITPMKTFANGDTFTFWSRKPTVTTDYPDRLEVRLSIAGASTNVGATTTSVGDFTTLLVTINPTLVVGVYPQVWTQYATVLSGLPAGTQSGRFAFRYWVTNGGLNGSNSDFIGIDTVSLVSSTPAELVRFSAD